MISKGAAQSWQMDNRWKAMSESKTEGFGFAIRVDAQGHGHLLRAGEEQATRSLPVAALVDQFYAPPRGARRQALGQHRLADPATSEGLATRRGCRTWQRAVVAAEVNASQAIRPCASICSAQSRMPLERVARAQHGCRSARCSPRCAGRGR